MKENTESYGRKMNGRRTRREGDADTGNFDFGRGRVRSARRAWPRAFVWARRLLARANAMTRLLRAERFDRRDGGQYYRCVGGGAGVGRLVTASRCIAHERMALLDAR